MQYIRRYFKYILGLLMLILIIFFGFFYNPKNTFVGKIQDETTPIPIIDWITYSSNYGFSFMHPSNVKVGANDTIINVGNIIAKVEILNCKEPTPTYKITSTTKLYGYPAEINEPEKIAYICNNTKTACLDIEKEKNFIETNSNKITEGFFHSFISSLNISKDFDKIPCSTSKDQDKNSNFWSKIF